MRRAACACVAGRYGRDMGEVWARCGGDIGEIWARYGRGMRGGLRLRCGLERVAGYPPLLEQGAAGRLQRAEERAHLAAVVEDVEEAVLLRHLGEI